MGKAEATASQAMQKSTRIEVKTVGMSKHLIIVGASGHGKVLADIAKKNGYDHISFLDDDIEKTECAGHRVIGTADDAASFPDCDFIVGIGDIHARKKIQQDLLKVGVRLVSLIHPNAIIAEDAVIGAGSAVMAGAVINPAAVIGQGCIINTGASIDHDNVLSDFVHVAVGSHLAGTVTVGECTLVGAGATVINDISICSDCVIAAGAVVVKSIEVSGTYLGVPAKKRP